MSTSLGRVGAGAGIVIVIVFWPGNLVVVELPTLGS